jgi:hypothetical protein
MRRATLRPVLIHAGPEFDDERARFAFVFCCEDCAHFEAATGRCRHFWPNASHRREHYARPLDTLDFCKEFEPC